MSEGWAEKTLVRCYTDVLFTLVRSELSKITDKIANLL